MSVETFLARVYGCARGSFPFDGHRAGEATSSEKEYRKVFALQQQVLYKI